MCSDVVYQVVLDPPTKCIDDDNGSSKTLNSFKASTLLKENDHIHKCVFVVDRNDLDRQTREDCSSSDKTLSKGKARRLSAGSANQFNRFQEGCVEENTNTAALVRLCYTLLPKLPSVADLDQAEAKDTQ